MNLIFCMECKGPVVIVAFTVPNPHTIECKLVCQTCKDAGKVFEGEATLDLYHLADEESPPPGQYL